MIDREGIVSLIEEYKNDIGNMSYVVDFMIVEDISQRDAMIDYISKEEDIIAVRNGVFTSKINHKLLIVIRTVLQLHYKKLYYSLLKINKDNVAIESSLRCDILSLVNLVLVFCPDNPSLYYLKKKIMLFLKEKNKVTEKLILSEYYYTTKINVLIRKNSISWDYRFFIVSNFISFLSIDDIDKNNSTKVDLKFLYCKLDIQCDTAKRTFIQVDVDRFNAVNMNERRNYHMWKYIILLFNSDFIDDEDKMYLFVYACYLFSNCLWDYSAYNFIVNFYKKLPLTKNNLLNLISYNKQTENVFTKDEHKSYLTELSNYLFKDK